MARSTCLSKHHVGAISQWGEAFIFIFIGKHAPNGSWTHNFTLHLKLVEAQVASLQKE